MTIKTYVISNPTSDLISYLSTVTNRVAIDIVSQKVTVTIDHVDAATALAFEIELSKRLGVSIDGVNTNSASKLEVSATSRILGRLTSGAGVVEELTGTQATSLLDAAGAATTGVVTSSSQTFGGDKTFNGGIIGGSFLQLTNDETITSTGTQNNLAVAATTSTIRFNPASTLTITGILISGGNSDGDILILHNVTAAQSVVLNDEDAGSTATNRFALSGNLTLSGDQSCVLQYDSTTTRWRLIAHGVIGGGSGAPTGAQYLVLAADGTLTAERVFTAGQNVSVVDSGAGAAYTVNVGTQSFTLSGIISPTTTGKQNDWNPTGLATAYEIRWNGADYLGLTGLTAGVDGTEKLFVNSTTDRLAWLENQNTSSSAANRFILPKGYPAFLMPGDSILLRYDGTASRWRVKEWATMGPCMGLTLFEEFYCSPGTADSTGNFLAGNNGGAGATIAASTYLQGSTERPLGMIDFTTGTTTTGRATISTPTTTVVPALGPALLIVRVAIQNAVDGTQTYQFATGWNDTANGFTDSVVWEYRWTGSAAEWSQTRAAGGAITRSNTGSPTPTTNYVWLVIFMNAAWTRADYIYSDDSISFTLSSSPTTGLPNNTQLLTIHGFILKSAGATSRSVAMDCFGYRYDYVRG